MGAGTMAISGSALAPEEEEIEKANVRESDATKRKGMPTLMSRRDMGNIRLLFIR
jgi:hypothetical protein